MEYQTCVIGKAMRPLFADWVTIAKCDKYCLDDNIAKANMQ